MKRNANPDAKDDLYNLMVEVKGNLLTLIEKLEAMEAELRHKEADPEKE